MPQVQCTAGHIAFAVACITNRLPCGNILDGEGPGAHIKSGALRQADSISWQ